MGKIVNDDLHRAGMAYRTRILGEARVREALATADDLTDYYHLLGHECAYGMIWPREQLTQRLRSLVTVAMLATMGFENILKVHVLGAIRNGCTRDEVRQALAAVTWYGGAAPASAAMGSMRAVLATAAPLKDVAKDPARSLAEIREKGQAIAQQLFPDEAEAQGLSGARSIYASIRNDYLFGTLWADQALSMRERALVVVAVLCANNRTGQMKRYCQAAIRLGCDVGELEEVFLTAAIYCGVAACEEGLAILGTL